MRVLLILSFFCIFASRGEELPEGWLGWHQKKGIKEAERIKAHEQLLQLNPIVGGVIAPVNAHPYLAGILIDVFGLPSPSACGGSLLSASRVLTAAHCWYDGNFYAMRFTVVLGTPYLFHGGLRIPTYSIAVHPAYNAQTLSNDIAMLGLPVLVPFSDAIKPVVLPYGRYLHEDFTAHWTSASGYGRYSDLTNPTTNTMVRNIFLHTIPIEQCRGIYGALVLDSNICTNGVGGVGICRGDSGGPLTINVEGNEILIGVSSFVAQDGCELGYPSVFARVTNYMDWIIQYL